MRLSSQRFLTWALAFLFGVLSLGDRGFHALTNSAHADEAGADAPEPSGDRNGEADGCAACEFFGQAQVVVDPPARAVASSSAPALVRPGLPHVDRTVEAAASPRGPPVRA
jgi:hypothetical protein